MNFVDLIQKKKQDINYTEEEIKYIVSSVYNGITENSQLSARLMAVNFRSLNINETLYLIKAITVLAKNISAAFVFLDENKYYFVNKLSYLMSITEAAGLWRIRLKY